jgi:segregation and condensation protein B
MDLKRIIEAILFSSAKPVTLKNLLKRLNDTYDHEEVSNALVDLKKEYNGGERAIEMAEVSGGFQMRTKVEYRDWARRFVRERDTGLTRSMLETLSIVAYKQPLTKKEIDTLRGVDSARVLKHLLERRLIEIAGRNGDESKRLVFRTTDKFLEVYGLRAIQDLPTLKEIEPFEK